MSGLEVLLTVLGRLPDAQVVHHLLRSCAERCRLTHLLWGCESTVFQDLVDRADDLIMEVIEGLLGETLAPSNGRRLDCRCPPGVAVSRARAPYNQQHAWQPWCPSISKDAALLVAPPLRRLLTQQ